MEQDEQQARIGLVLYTLHTARSCWPRPVPRLYSQPATPVAGKIAQQGLWYLVCPCVCLCDIWHHRHQAGI